MQNYQGIIDTEDQPRISQADKLFFCVFLALAFHGMLFFGIGFQLPQLTSSKYQKSFNVVLAQFEAEQKPEKADFIGQANQEGGGDSEQLLAPSATEMAQFNDPDDISSEPAFKQSTAETRTPNSDVLTGSGDTQVVYQAVEHDPQQRDIPDAASLIDKHYQLTGLIANLDNQNVNQARKGRKRAVSASIHRSSDALYLDSWRRKVERIGNLNYPEKAKLEKIYGNVTMKVAINRNGTISEVVILESSGKKLLDDAALRIVRLSAPFKPLTKEMTKDTDILEIIRIWQFQPDYRLSTN